MLFKSNCYKGKRFNVKSKELALRTNSFVPRYLLLALSSKKPASFYPNVETSMNGLPVSGVVNIPYPVSNPLTAYPEVASLSEIPLPVARYPSVATVIIATIVS